MWEFGGRSEIGRSEFSESSKTLLRRVNRCWDCLWHFIDQPELFEPTNNRAERTIRHLVRLRIMTVEYLC